ncbi:hypothetical protein BO86DRAFT_122876 [Aspergillus japonicus CBS 114.51]|uniref:Uncharacterized protein n=1 Tax=Aspergillus japonicus CBS 114.51 TaxID=1448312 RepID=A0A8T8WXX4_ASPJA|nr:hypothetical protein BO86DRAFT_122876 [Aspergillus japonicus CBS 114.51]RAH80737.1 hypothetical protein BO86DRAFT_122876 [Aspergillus japonicus CBS 114.51]
MLLLFPSTSTSLYSARHLVLQFANRSPPHLGYIDSDMHKGEGEKNKNPSHQKSQPPLQHPGKILYLQLALSTLLEVNGRAGPPARGRTLSPLDWAGKAYHYQTSALRALAQSKVHGRMQVQAGCALLLVGLWACGFKPNPSIHPPSLIAYPGS